MSFFFLINSVCRCKIDSLCIDRRKEHQPGWAQSGLGTWPWGLTPPDLILATQSCEFGSLWMPYGYKTHSVHLDIVRIFTKYFWLAVNRLASILGLDQQAGHKALIALDSGRRKFFWFYSSELFFLFFWCR